MECSDRYETGHLGNGVRGGLEIDALESVLKVIAQLADPGRHEYVAAIQSAREHAGRRAAARIERRAQAIPFASLRWPQREIVHRRARCLRSKRNGAFLGILRRKLRVR